MQHPDNKEIAEVLERIAELLEVQDANPFRVRAYRRAAGVVRHSDRSITEMVVSEDSLEDLPEIGQSLASSIREYVHTGQLRLLDRLEGEVSPEALFETIPGIGEKLAHRIAKSMEIETLEELELAAHDGSLEQVPGIGRRKVRAIRDSLHATLSRSSRRRARRISEQQQTATNHPEVDTILEVDAEYREKAKHNDLRTIAPRRFNPENRSWLPVLHTERDEWNFTAMYSNTARAHELGKTDDWVVIYYERVGHENQCTVVTEYQGPLTGKRVIRGHEQECRAYYSDTRTVP